MVFWASCSCEDDLVVAKVRSVNSGCVYGKEVVRPSTLKDIATLNVADFKEYNKWLLEEEKVTYKAVRDKLLEYRHHRWAYWHVMCPDNPNVDPNCSMFVWLAFWVGGSWALGLVCSSNPVSLACIGLGCHLASNRRKVNRVN